MNFFVVLQEKRIISVDLCRFFGTLLEIAKRKKKGNRRRRKKKRKGEDRKEKGREKKTDKGGNYQARAILSLTRFSGQVEYEDDIDNIDGQN